MIVPSLHAHRLSRLRGLYAIVDDSAALPPLELVSAFIRAGAEVIQLRLKRAAAGELLNVAKAAAQACQAAGVLFLVNDRPDVAKLARADGVHLGQEDLPVDDARAVLGPDALIGVSTHSDQELDGALAAGADYLGFGPIFATASKPGAPLPPPQGLVKLALAVRRAGRTKVVAIGGITAANAREVMDAGPACVAAIGELCRAANPEEAARRLAEQAALR